ncbi:MAG TPA: hypothetical protein VHV08_07340, partial [Pirellulales bacterium]|nr:hypothetical protein [Pirellulales bacterium]
GLWFLRRRVWKSPAIWGVLLLLCFTAVHAAYWTDMRMRAPLAVVTCILAAEGLSVLLACCRRATHAVETV